MLKPRIIGILVVRKSIVVQSIAFSRYLPLGKPEIALDYLNQWGIDEITLLEIDASHEKRKPCFELVKSLSKYCQVPLAVGGGISELSDIERLINCGADKIVLNTALSLNPGLLTKGAELFGAQAIVASIDAKNIDSGKYEVFLDSGRIPTGLSPVELAKRAEACGAGEILLNSIDRDGSKNGYDIELIRQVDAATSIPVIVCGGAGHPGHFAEGIKAGAAAVAAANFLHFIEHSVIAYKNFLKLNSCNIRLDSYATYDGFGYDFDGRVSKIDDKILDKLRFEYIPEEVI